MRSAPKGSPVKRALTYLALIIVSLLYAAPLLWMLSTSAKPEGQTLRTPPSLVADPWWTTPKVAAENYVGAWTDPIVNFPLYLRNTLVVAGLGVTGMVLSSAVIAYGFARLQWRGRGTLFAIVLATMMIPFPVLMAPLFLIFRDLGWNGTL